MYPTKTQKALDEAWAACKVGEDPTVAMAEAMARLEREHARTQDALRSVLNWDPRPPEHWRYKDQEAFIADIVKAREVLNA